MTSMTTASTFAVTRTTGCHDDYDNAKCHVYDAECALSAARATGIDEWIAAAAEKLHEALVEYLGMRPA